MKKIPYSLLALLLLATVSCKKTDSTLATPNISVSDAADLMASSLALNSSGVTNVSDDATYRSKIIIDTKAACGSTSKDTVTRHSEPGSATTFTYGFGYTHTLNCNANNLPDNVMSKVNYSGTFSGPRITSANAGSASLRVGGLTSTAAAYVVNGTYVRSGSFTSKVDTTNHGSSNASITLTNLLLTKPSRTIASGTGTFTLTGTVPKKGNYSYTGTIVFNGDGTAKLTVNGTVFNVNLSTGEKTKV